MVSAGRGVAGDRSSMTAPRHILALYEPHRRGDEALREAVALAAHGARLTVVTVAVAEPTNRTCCDLRSVYWNEVVREIATDELKHARAAIGARGVADFRVVSGRSIPVAVAHEAERCGADLVVVPRERALLPWSRTRRARQVQRRTDRAAVVIAPG